MGRRGRRRDREALGEVEGLRRMVAENVLTPVPPERLSLAEVQAILERAIAGAPPVRGVTCRTRAEADELFDLAKRAVASGIVLPPARRVRADG